ncbi:hypothetical protein NKR23_g12145 [Pleurostoma richardsiae]|uniref:Uncharacterized protein n=1 Tax=Pleurostoma richardsiae TaxID=41990 RepID=A0AA38RA30_9PEZI|nr:hypothetical protein NKR23_g12145 [Pleurostoma richardsiae]
MALADAQTTRLPRRPRKQQPLFDDAGGISLAVVRPRGDDRMNRMTRDFTGMSAKPAATRPLILGIGVCR